MTVTTAAPRRAGYRYPVRIEQTVTYVVWVEAESQAEAVKSVECYDAHELTRSESPLDGYTTVEVPDMSEIEASETIGPKALCRECGVEEREPSGMKWAPHHGDCPQHIHHADTSSVYENHERIGWLARCSCKQEGFDAPFLSATPDELPEGIVIHSTRESAGAVLREHVAGRIHSPNKPLGIEGDYK